MTAYDRVKAARAKGRPTALAYIHALTGNFMEFHGDRRYGDDPAILAGVAELDGLAVTVIAIEKGADTAQRLRRNFGAAHPEGYRKALRHMKLAEKFQRPVLCLIDTSGAFCGIDAEERGQGQAIAENLMEMMTLKTPVLSLIIGEGGSGGALALAVADEVWIMENAVYSVISPEGCASILWKDPTRTEEASERLKLTAQDLLALGVVERVIGERDGVEASLPALKPRVLEFFREKMSLPSGRLLEERYEKFRKIGRV